MERQRKEIERENNHFSIENLILMLIVIIPFMTVFSYLYNLAKSHCPKCKEHWVVKQTGADSTSEHYQCVKCGFTRQLGR